MERNGRRTAAHYEHPCFQMFLWYPTKEGTWELLFGRDKSPELHIELWEREGVKVMARNWGVDSHDLPPGIGDDVIPTGYVDFIEWRGRELMALVVPDPMPPGWDEYRLKRELRCGSDIKRVNPSERRAIDFVKFDALIEALHELQRDRPLQESAT